MALNFLKRDCKIKQEFQIVNFLTHLNISSLHCFNHGGGSAADCRSEPELSPDDRFDAVDDNGILFSLESLDIILVAVKGLKTSCLPEGVAAGVFNTLVKVEV